MRKTEEQLRKALGANRWSIHPEREAYIDGYMQGQDNMTLQWTDKSPTESGFYWMKPYGHLDPEIVEVIIQPGKPYALFYECGSDSPNYNSNTSHLWAGPIPKPEE